MALTSWNDILNKPAALDQVDEIALEVSQLSSSVLSINTDIENIENEEVTITTENTVLDNMVFESQGIVYGHIAMEVSATANTWTVIGSINKVPELTYIVPFINGNNGTYGGMIQFGRNGSINIYSKETITSASINATFIYKVGTLTRSEEPTETKKKTIKKK